MVSPTVMRFLGASWIRTTFEKKIIAPSNGLEISQSGDTFANSSGLAVTEHSLEARQSLCV